MPATARHSFKYHVHVFYLVYLISGVLCIWGGCLIARVIANRLELGLFRRKKKRAFSSAASPAGPVTRRRSGWWTMVAFLVMGIGTGAAFLGHDADTGMSARAWHDWQSSMAFALMIASLGLSGGLALIGFRFDPHLGRRRCPKCWYDLSATKGLLCPECGHEAQTERSLYRTRRSRRTVALAIVPVLLAPVVPRLMYAYRVGWVGLVPSTVLVLGWNYLPDPVVGSSGSASGAMTPALPGSLERRAESNELWSWQRALLEWRCRMIGQESDDPVQVLRAINLEPRLYESRDMRDSMIRRLPKLLARMSDPNARQREAAIELMGMYWGLLESGTDEVKKQFVDGVVNAKREVVAQATGKDPFAATPAVQLLGHPRIAEHMDASDIAKFEAFLTSSSTPQWNREMTVTILAEAAQQVPLIADMFLHVLDSKDKAVQQDVAPIIMIYSTDPRVISRAVETILTAEPSLAVQVSRASLRQAVVGRDELRAAVFTRFSADQFANPVFWDTVGSSFAAYGLSPHERDLIRPGLIKALRSVNRSAVTNVLGIISQGMDRSDEVRAALDEYIRDQDPDSPEASNARAIRDKLFPPDPK